MTLLMNKFTNIVLPIYFEFIRIWYTPHPNIFVMKKMSWKVEIWMENHLVSVSRNCNIVNL